MTQPVLGLKRPVEPAVLRRLDSGRAALHEVLRVEVRARWIWRTGCGNDGQVTCLIERQQWLQCWMQSEYAIQIQHLFCGMAMLGRIA